MKSNIFNLGDIVYFIESSNFIRKATIINCSAGFCTIKFETGNSGPSGIRVRESKIYKSEQEAKAIIESRKKYEQDNR